jgi:uncharacterized protein YcfJ
MNKALTVGTVLVVAVAVAASVFAGYQLLQNDEQAQDQQTLAAAIPSASTTTPSASTPVDECDPNYTDPRDKHRIAGTVAGAVVGGAVGNDVGDSDVTTAAGAAAGAFAGHEIQKNLQENKAAKAGCAE